MKELDILFENFWVIKDKNPQLYNEIKDASPEYRSFVEEKLGYRLITNPRLIKLEKLPGLAESWMGINRFDSNFEYALLCLLLAFLEDKGDGDQFVLSQITEYLATMWPDDEKLDWTLYRHRRLLVKVLRFASEFDLMRVDDGDEGKFIDATDAEVLYASTGLSRYFVRLFSFEILNCSSLEEIELADTFDMDADRGRLRRHRVYRRLFMGPAVYNGGPEDADYAYIKNFKSMIQKDVEDMLEANLHVHKNGAFDVYDPSKYRKDVFPDSSTISNIVLQITNEISERVENGAYTRAQDDTVTVSRVEYEGIIEKCRNEYSYGWSKEYREKGSADLYKTVGEYMEDFGMIVPKNGGREVVLLPLCAKIKGRYSPETLQKFGTQSNKEGGGPDEDDQQ